MRTAYCCRCARTSLGVESTSIASVELSILIFQKRVLITSTASVALLDVDGWCCLVLPCPRRYEELFVKFIFLFLCRQGKAIHLVTKYDQKLATQLKLGNFDMDDFEEVRAEQGRKPKNKDKVCVCTVELLALSMFARATQHCENTVCHVSNADHPQETEETNWNMSGSSCHCPPVSDYVTNRLGILS